MRTNAAVDFEISGADIEILEGTKGETDYGEASRFPVFDKKRDIDGIAVEADGSTGWGASQENQ
jgi:hypothetical protein